jgi:hypothetical protein
MCVKNAGLFGKVPGGSVIVTVHALSNCMVAKFISHDVQGLVNGAFTFSSDNTPLPVVHPNCFIALLTTHIEQ